MSSQIPPLPYFHQQEDLLFALKPAKLTSHQSTPNLIGFKEYLEWKLKRPLWLTHRLDLGTSGVMVLAQTKEAARQLAALFESNQVQKKYFFVSRGKKPSWANSSTPQKIQSLFEGDAAPARTDIYFLASLTEQDHLYCALPHTGKTHQIRKHAAELKIPLLGDPQYGGATFSHLLLFAQEIEFEWNKKNIHFQNPLLSFASPATQKKILNPFYLSHLDRKYLFHSENPNFCYRLTHDANFPVRIDRYGDKLAVSNFAESLNETMSRHLKDFIQWTKETENLTTLPMTTMTNRGANNNKQKLLIENQATLWTAQENDLLLSLRNDRGQSYGVFLDQRENRKFIFENSKNKTVLNLFSYTGAFSVAAAKGEAKNVCTVDVSPTFIQWSKENFSLNNLQTERHEFWVQDSLLFLKSCHKRNRQFDIIICDPPSMGRSKDQVFRIDKDWSTLLDLCMAVLSPNGMILFSNNYEKWGYKMWYQKIKAWNKKGLQIHLGLRSPDHEPFHRNPIMKSFFMTRGNHGMNIPAHCKIAYDTDLMGV